MDSLASEVRALVQRTVALEQRAGTDHAAIERYFNQRVDTINEQMAEARREDAERWKALNEAIEARADKLYSLFKAEFGIFDERFKAVDSRFNERDKRHAEKDQSMREAMAKSETATSKQVDQLGVVINNVREGFTRTIDDVKERIGRVENKDAGRNEQRQTNNSSVQLWTAVIGTVCTILGLVIGYLINYHSIIPSVTG